MKQFAKVNKDRCISCGVCGSIAPKIFDYDCRGLAEYIFGGDNNRGAVAVPKHRLIELYDAILNCPTEAILSGELPFTACDNGEEER